ncbi:MAG: insulinase family protein [Acidobacteria bacterium]|nr:insulinase family protein [Acidobacteriota bacterium]
MAKRLLLLLFLTQTAFAAKLAVPRLDYKHRTLSNGLEVYTLQDRTTPTVAIQVWYRVGSKNDPEGRSGFAHLFEHIMFKATKHMPSEMMDRLTEDVGGMNNATTRDDATQYFEVIPSNYLETLLWAEGERLGSLTVDDANFKSERDVVKEEYRFRVLAPPYGRLYYALDKDSFTVHPYKRPGIGSIEDLDAATLTDVQQFHSTFYRPDNAVLVIAGDFDQKQLDGWVDKYLGPIANPGTPIPRVTAKEPARTEEKRFVEKAPNVPLPAVGITWLTPSASSEDSYALSMASAILGMGDSSRMTQSLVYKQKIAQDANVFADLREDLGVFVVLVTLASGHSVEEGEKAARAELQKLIDTPVSDAEMEKARNLIAASVLRQRETNNGRAAAIGEAVVVSHDPEDVNTGLEKTLAVTAADVQRVMKKYIGDGKAVVIQYVAEGGKK